MPVRVESSEEVQRIATLLDKLIAFQKVPIGTIEKKMGVAQGYLARVFRGESYLRFHHVLVILEAIDISPRRFFKLAFEEDDDGHDKELSAFLSRRSQPAPPSAPMTFREEDLEQVVMRTLEKLDLLKAPAPAPAKPRKPRQPKS